MNIERVLIFEERLASRRGLSLEFLESAENTLWLDFEGFLGELFKIYSIENEVVIDDFIGEELCSFLLLKSEFLIKPEKICLKSEFPRHP